MGTWREQLDRECARYKVLCILLCASLLAIHSLGGSSHVILTVGQTKPRLTKNLTISPCSDLKWTDPILLSLVLLTFLKLFLFLKFARVPSSPPFALSTHVPGLT